MLRAPFSPQIAAQVRQRRQLLAEQVAAQFAVEVEARDKARGEELVACIDALCSFETIERCAYVEGSRSTAPDGRW